MRERGSTQIVPRVSIGDQELALLRFLADRGGATLREAAEEFGTPRQLARTTVLTMLERLRHKRYLGRGRVGGVYQYVPTASARDTVRHVVQRFVSGTLGGSLSPLTAYLAETGDVSDEELAELEQLVTRLRQRKRRRDR